MLPGTSFLALQMIQRNSAPPRCPHCGKVLPGDDFRVWPIFVGTLLAVYAVFTIVGWVVDQSEYGDRRTLMQFVAAQCAYVWHLLGRLW